MQAGGIPMNMANAMHLRFQTQQSQQISDLMGLYTTVNNEQKGVFGD